MPKFVPRPGQVDFAHIRWAPVINCVLQYKNKFLIVQRSAKMNIYPNFWNGIAGYLDDHKSLEEKVYEEMREEVGLRPKDIVSLRRGPVFDYEAPQYNKTWVIHPVLVKIKTDKVKTDWEAQNYRWVKLNEIKKFKIIPSFGLVVKSLFPKFQFRVN